MDRELFDRLRRNQELGVLPDGRETVGVTLQFTGAVPGLPRPERRTWLEDRFSEVQGRFDERIHLKPGTMSVSAQSVEATVLVDDFDVLRRQLREDDVDMIVTSTFTVIDRSK